MLRSKTGSERMEKKKKMEERQRAGRVRQRKGERGKESFEGR